MLFPCRKGGAVPSTESGLTRFMLLLLKLGLPGAGETDLKKDHTNNHEKDEAEISEWFLKYHYSRRICTTLTNNIYIIFSYMYHGSSN